MPIPKLQSLPLIFPMKGLHEASGQATQPDGTSPLALNVRSYDLVTQRDVGCQRVGMLKAVASNQTGEAITLMCVGYVGKVQWAISSPTGSGASWEANSGFKLERHAPSTTITVQSPDGGNPGAMSNANSVASFVHAGSASPNPTSLGLGAYSYGLGAAMVDDNGVAGDGAGDRTFSIIDMVFGVLSLKQAGELAYQENFAYADGEIHTVSAGRWSVGNDGFSPAVSPVALSSALVFPNTGTILCAGKTTGQAAGIGDGPTFSDTGNLVLNGLSFITDVATVWAAFTTNFKLPGTGFKIKVLFHMTAASYVTSTLKGLFDGITQFFRTSARIFLQFPSGNNANFEARYNSFTNTWQRRVRSSDAFVTASELLVDGSANTLTLNGAGTSHTLTLNGVSIGTITGGSAPTTIQVLVGVTVGFLDGAGAATAIGSVPVGAILKHPLTVTDILISGDKKASAL